MSVSFRRNSFLLTHCLCSSFSFALQRTAIATVAKVGAEAFAFSNIARFALPLRIGLAISTVPFVQENIVDRFGLGKDDDDAEKEE